MSQLSSAIAINSSIGAVSINARITRSSPTQLPTQLPLAAANAGTLATRSDDTSGIVTLATGHGVQTDDVVDVYWDGGRRFNVVAGSVSGDDVIISGGAGDNLPAEDATLTLQVQQVLNLDFDGDAVEAMAAACGARGRLQFYSDAVLELGVDLAANAPWIWWESGVGSNPLAGKSITHATITQASTSEVTFRLGIDYDSTE